MMENIVNKTIVAGNDKLFEQSINKNEETSKENKPNVSVRNTSSVTVESLKSRGRGHSVFISGFNREK